jgi:hypothetical protein
MRTFKACSGQRLAWQYVFEKAYIAGGRILSVDDVKFRSIFDLALFQLLMRVDTLICHSRLASIPSEQKEDAIYLQQS